MNKSIVRLASLTIKNIKNVKKGTVVMPLDGGKMGKMGKSEILGI